MVTPMVRDRISQLVSEAIERARREGVVQLETTPQVLMERPGNPGHGDFATSLPLRLARATRINPLQLAQLLVERMPDSNEVAKVEAAHPGFVNFFLDNGWVQSQVETIREAGAEYGGVDFGAGQRVMVEFVSVNPTGPVHVGHTRGAVMGSALANVLDAAGFDVTREYYVNDAGNQMDVFYRSVYARYLQSLGREAEFPANGYQGEYIGDLGREIGEAEGSRFLGMTSAEAVTEIGDVAREKMVANIRQDLEGIGVVFDNWYSERTLYENGDYEQAMDLLRGKNFLSERESAVWFNSSMLGDEKDNVVVRSSGEPTYFASDIAYHYNKFVARDFAQVIDIWGADHQGHVPRMKAAVEALGHRPGRIDHPDFSVGDAETGRRDGAGVQAHRRFCHPAGVGRRGRHRRLPILLPGPGSFDANGVRLGAGQEGVDREPGLLHSVRPCPHRQYFELGGGAGTGLGDGRRGAADRPQRT